MEMSVVDREWVKLTIDATPEHLAAATAVRAAFLLHDGAPQEADWVVAELDAADIRVLVGPGAHELAPATYRAWGEITAPPELLRLPSGTVHITP